MAKKLGEKEVDINTKLTPTVLKCEIHRHGFN